MIFPEFQFVRLILKKAKMVTFCLYLVHQKTGKLRKKSNYTIDNLTALMVRLIQNLFNKASCFSHLIGFPPKEDKSLIHFKT
jgi:hypothetical protein